MENQLPTDASQLDPKVLKVVRTLRDIESGGDYNAVGDNGESHGAYQFNKDNYKNWAKQYLGDENAPMTPANQNKLMYLRVKEQKDQGLQPEEIAAIHNGAHKDANGRYQYNAPEYGEKFRKAIASQPKVEQGFNPAPFSAPSDGSKPAPVSTLEASKPEEPGLVSRLKERAQEGSQALSDTGTGKINLLSGAIQTVGAGAGALNDVVQSTLELVPGVKQLENLIGQGAGSLAKTEVGQSVVKSIEEFSKKHPELSKDIGAGFNILTAIPIFKGLKIGFGAAKNAAMDATSVALHDTAVKSATKDMTAAFAKTKTLSKTFERNGGQTTLQNAVSKGLVPDIENGKYVTKSAADSTEEMISHIEDTKLQPLLEAGDSPLAAHRVPLETYKQNAMQMAKDELKDAGPVEKYFERIQEKYGDYPTIGQLNEAKRIVAKNIKEASFASPTASTDKIVRSTLQQSVEDGANALKLGDVQAINKEMADLIKYQKMLVALDGTPVKIGKVRHFMQHTIGTGVGYGTAKALGTGPAGELIGGYLGNKAANLVEKKTVGGVLGKFINRPK